MTTIEYQVLDELYFITTFQSLHETLQIDASLLKETLKNLFIKGWVKCGISLDEDIEKQEMVDIHANFDKYYYSISKEGLMAHNVK